MRKFITLNLFAFAFLTTNGQSITSPESVEYDALYDRYLISNSAGNSIVAMDQAGTVTAFASGIASGPFGIEILDSVLYACAGGFVRGYHLATGIQVFSLNVNASFLNGITTDGTFIYVTDFSGAKIIKVDVDATTFSVLVANTNGTPNGIVYDPDQGGGMLWTAFWGSIAPVKGYMLDGSAGPVVPTTLSNIDGITRDCFGDLYLASWTPDAVTRLVLGPNTLTNMGWSVANPADIDFDAVNSRICIPNTSSSTVTLEDLTVCATSVEERASIATFSVYPNPTTDNLFVTGPADMNTTFRILDAAMRVVQSGPLRGKSSIGVGQLLPGVYLLVLKDSVTGQRFIVAE